MFRTVLAVTAIAVGITAVAAQSDPIAARKQHMKDVGAQTKTGGGMAKGEVPYDQAKAQGIFATYVTAGDEAADLFPETSKTGGDTAALAGDLGQHGRLQGAGRQVRRGCQGGAELGEGPRQFKAAFSGRDQELRRLPRDLPREEELIARAHHAIRKGGRFTRRPLAFRAGASAHRLSAEGGSPMLRKLILLAIAAAIVGLAVFWFVTIPATVPASALGEPHARSRERQDHVLRRRLRLLPRDARTRTTRRSSAAGSG